MWQACFYLSIVLGIATGTVAGEGLEHGLGGWRWPFLLESMVMSPFAVLLILLERDPSLRPNEELHYGFVAQMKSLFCNDVYVTAMLGASVLMFTLGGLAFWGPDFLQSLFSISAWEAALSFSLVILFSGVVGTMLGAVFMDSRLAGPQQILASGGMSEEAFQAVRVRLGCLMVFVCVTAGGACGLVGVWVQQFLLFMLVLGFISLVLFIAFAPAGMVILSCVERPLRGQAQGVFIFFVHLLGDFPSPYVLGFMKDHLGVRWSLFTMVSWMLLGASVLAIALIFSIRRVSSLYTSEPEAKSLLKPSSM